MGEDSSSLNFFQVDFTQADDLLTFWNKINFLFFFPKIWIYIGGVCDC